MSRILLRRPHKHFQFCHRTFSTSSHLSEQPKPFTTGPSPPRLPPEEQAEFEQLQRASTGAFSTPKQMPSSSISHQSPLSATSQPSHTSSPSSPSAANTNKPPQSSSSSSSSEEEEELHPDVRKALKPEFEGDRNPRTGEIGGPKQEPIRWGSDGQRGIGVTGAE